MSDIKRKTVLEGHSEKNVSLDLSKMSLLGRAQLSVLIEKDGDEDLRQHLLGAVGRAEMGRRAHRTSHELPTTWTMIHVLDRLEEAFRIISMMPAATGPQIYGSAWPNYNPMTQGELKAIRNEIYQLGGQSALSAWESEQNRVRLQPSSAQVSRMEQASRWPFEFLRDKPELARAISFRAMWSAMRVDIRKHCQRKGIDHETFNQQWQQGLNIITATLITRHVPVS